MNNAQEVLSQLEQLKKSVTTSDEFDPKALAQLNVDSWNNRPGNLDKEDGYNCPICKNRGDIAEVMEYRPGWWTERFIPCKCKETRANIRRMTRSGLGNVIRDKTFEKFNATEPWQQTIKNAAMQYAKDPEGWFFLGGQSGAGKSHICTAICREFLLRGNTVSYMLWLDDIAELKTLGLDAEKRAATIGRFKRADVLYIDDLFKPADGQDGTKQMPTPADIRLTYEIINFRYLNPKLLTIVSSEWTQGEIVDIDEATGGRIFEKCGKNGINIPQNRERNYRLKGAVTV